MTQTGKWLEDRRLALSRRRVAAVALSAAGAVLLSFALGVTLGRLGIYRGVPVAVTLGWIGAIVATVMGILFIRRTRKSSNTQELAAAVERRGQLRRGSIAGLSNSPSNGSASLFANADGRAATWLRDHGVHALQDVARRDARSAVFGAVVGVVGFSVFVVSGPTHNTGVSFWRPDVVLATAFAPIGISVDREDVRKGDTVVVSVRVAGADVVVLETRAPGQTWQRDTLLLNQAGRAQLSLGPLEADHYVRAVSGRRVSPTLHVRVVLPAFLASLNLVAKFPDYLERSDESLFPGDSIHLPVGTRVSTQGQATVVLAGVLWTHAQGDSVVLNPEGSRFQGEFLVARSGRWELEIVPQDGAVLDDPNPTLVVTLVPDSVPIVDIPMPGVDTVLGANLRQPIVVDARDDHRVTKVELETRRVSRTGITEDAQVELLFQPEDGVERAMLHWVVDLNNRGFLPGDTAYYKVRAFDNSPRAQWGESNEFLLRVPARNEMREDLRDALSELTDNADSLFRAQQELADQTEELNAEQRRNAEQGQEEMEFRAAEQAAKVGQEQNQLMDRAQKMADQLEELAKSAWDAGVTDPELQQQLKELQDLLEKSLTPDMQQSLDQLEKALEELDPEAVRDALEKLQEQQQKMQEQLERSRELMERAALEGSMETLAKDAEELATRQEEWNEAAGKEQQSDSALAAAEQQLANEAERLAQQLEQVQEMAAERGELNSAQMEAAQQRAQQAAQQMQNAVEQMQNGQRDQAQQSGEQASEQLDPLSQDLQQQLEKLRQEMQEEVLKAMDEALSETAELARRQQDVQARMARGESGADVRGEQAAIRESVDRVIERLQETGGKNALVSPDLGTALGVSRQQMTEALSQFEQPTPNTRQASEQAGQALDGLNAVAAALMRNRDDVEGSESGSGMAEAMQQMAEMAAQQESMNGETGSLMPMVQQGGQELLQQLQEIAGRERGLAEELERMAAQEAMPGATEELAREAEEIARLLEQGQLDPQTLERQEQLFKKLLDAGRSLRSEEEDDELERKSQTARPNNVVLAPATLDPNALGPGLRYPYPAWDQLRRFSPEERRLILDYFRRLNNGGT